MALRLKQCLESDWTSKLTLQKMCLGIKHSRPIRTLAKWLVHRKFGMGFFHVLFCLQRDVRRTRHLGSWGNMGELDSSTCPIEEHVLEVAWEGWKHWKLIRTVFFAQKDLLDEIKGIK